MDAPSNFTWPAGAADAALRRHWTLDPRVTYLNHASYGACPAAVLARQSELRAELEREPVQFLSRRLPERLDASRRELAQFLGAANEDLAFVANVTVGVNAVLRSVPLAPGDELLTTSHDYGACRNILKDAAERSGARVIVADLPFPLAGDDDIVAAVLGAVTPRTRLAMIDHISSGSALVFPVERLVRELQARGVLVLVDGAHAPGMLPVALDRLQADFYTGNLHKWVCAPKGAGFIWARRDRQARLHPAIVGRNLNPAPAHLMELHHRFEWPGTFDPTAWLCVGEALRWMGAVLPGGWPEVMRRNRDLACAARRYLCTRLGVAPPCPETMLGSMAALPLPQRFQRPPVPRPPAPGFLASTAGTGSPEGAALYERFGVEVPIGWFGTPPRWVVRISAQVYNTPEDYERLADSLDAL